MADQSAKQAKVTGHRTNQDRFEQTRQALILSARELFADQGFNQTHTAQVVERANLTRGALYYHFKDKSELFEAVFEEVALEMRRKIRRKVRNIDDPWRLLQKACEAYLDCAAEPEFQRIVLQEALSVVGWARWQEVLSSAAEADLVIAIQQAMEAGYLLRADPYTVSRLLAGAFREGAFMIANAKNRRATRSEISLLTSRVLDSLRHLSFED